MFSTVLYNWISNIWYPVWQYTHKRFTRPHPMARPLQTWTGGRGVRWVGEGVREEHAPRGVELPLPGGLPPPPAPPFLSETFVLKKSFQKASLFVYSNSRSQRLYYSSRPDPARPDPWGLGGEAPRVTGGPGGREPPGKGRTSYMFPMGLKRFL